MAIIKQDLPWEKAKLSERCWRRWFLCRAVVWLLLCGLSLCFNKRSFRTGLLSMIPTQALFPQKPFMVFILWLLRGYNHTFVVLWLCHIPLLMPKNFYLIVWESATVPWAGSAPVRTCGHPESAQWDSAFKFNFLVAKKCVFIWSQVEKGSQVGVPWSNFSFHVYELHPCLWWAEAKMTVGGSF